MNRTHWFLVIWIAVLLLYMFFAAVFSPTELTISRSLSMAAKNYPIVAFMLGLVLGVFAAHVFW